MLSLKLYKNSKEEFLNLAKKATFADKTQFLDSITPNKTDNYKNLIMLLNDLMEIDFFNYTTTDSALFFKNSIDSLMESYLNNESEYQEFIHNIPAKNNTTTYEPLLYILKNFLPGNESTLTETIIHSYEFFDSNKNEEEVNYTKYTEALIKINPMFAEHAYRLKYRWKLNQQDQYKLDNTLCNYDFIPKIFKLQHKMKEINNSIGSHPLNNDELIITDKYKLFINSNSNKKALVIYGHDHNGAFNGENTEFNLFINGYSVLVIDARNKIIAIADINKAIQETNYQDSTEIYINMHGSNALFATDTLLTLNDKFSSEYSMVSATNLFKALMNDLNNQPLKAIIASCHSQLVTHKISTILPEGSEMMTLSENQIIEGNHYIFNGRYDIYESFNELHGQENLRALSAKTHYNLSSGYYLPSVTYGKLGYCNFRTPVNFNQKDLTELLSKTSKKEVSANVINYLNHNNDIQVEQDVMQFFSVFNSTNENYPLLNYRNSSGNDFNKMLGIADALYAIYDQCGNGYIQDSNFTPNQDNIITENLLGVALNAPPFISNTIFWLAGKVINATKTYYEHDEF